MSNILGVLSVLYSMNWLKRIWTKSKVPVDNAQLDDLIWNNRVKLPTYDYANRHFEPQWMLRVRQEDLNKNQLLELIDQTPKDELLTTNYNNETLLSLLIEKDEYYIPCIKALLEKHPESYNDTFKVKNLKSYVEYALEKNNIPAYKLLIQQISRINLDDNQYENFLSQLSRFAKDHDTILSEGLEKIQNLKDIPWEVIQIIFKEQLYRGCNNDKILFRKSEKKALLTLLNKQYFGENLHRYLDFIYELFNHNTTSIIEDDADLNEVVSKLHDSKLIPKVKFIEEVFNHKLSIFNNKMYLNKYSKSLYQLGFTNKALIKEINHNLFIEKGPIIKVNEGLIDGLIKVKDMDPQLLIPLVVKWDNSSDLLSWLSKPLVSFECLLKVYSPRRVIQLLINEIDNPSFKGEYEFIDTFTMTSKLYTICLQESLTVKDFFPDKPTSLHEIHEAVWREHSKLKNKNIKLHSYYPKEWLKLNGLKCGELTIEIPEDSHRLVYVGQYLSICVGGGSYRDKIVDKTSFIVLLKNKNIVEFCIEVTDKDILQFKTYRNESNTNHPSYNVLKEMLYK